MAAGSPRNILKSGKTLRDVERTAKTFKNSEMEGWADQILAMSRRNAKAVVGIITGHGTLRKHRHTMGLEKDPRCRFCGKEDERSLHVILECPALVERRHLYLGDLFPLVNNIGVKDVRKMLQFYEKTMD